MVGSTNGCVIIEDRLIILDLDDLLNLIWIQTSTWSSTCSSFETRVHEYGGVKWVIVSDTGCIHIEISLEVGFEVELKLNNCMVLLNLKLKSTFNSKFNLQPILKIRIFNMVMLIYCLDPLLFLVKLKFNFKFWCYMIPLTLILIQNSTWSSTCSPFQTHVLEYGGANLVTGYDTGFVKIGVSF